MKELFGKLTTDKEGNPFSNRVSINGQDSTEMLKRPAHELQRKGEEALKEIDEKRRKRKELKKQSRKARATAALD